MKSFEQSSTEKEKAPEYSYEVLDPRFGNPRFAEEAKAANEAVFQKGHVMGIEVTVPELAERCDLGNIDPQHTEDNVDLAAIEVVETMDLPGGDITFTTIRADLDSVGSMALVALRQDGVEISPEIKERLIKIADSDKFARGGWPGQRPLPAKEELYEDSNSAMESQELSAIAAATADFKVSLSERVSTLRHWLETGEEPESYREQVDKSREDLVNSLENGEISIDTHADGKIATVESTHRAGTSLGYTQAPIVVAVNPEFSFQGSDPIRKYTISQYEAGYVDLKAVFAELAEIEEGWGGSPNIGGSPQGTSSELSMDQIVEVVERHLISEDNI